jgi:mono/diheme cytochrome c family protein
VRQSIAVLLLATATLVGIASCAARPALDATGEEIYIQLCARCHGEDLSGGLGPALGAGSNAAEQDDAFLELTITRGRGRMPSFGGTLTDEQLQRLIDYIRSQQ